MTLLSLSVAAIWVIGFWALSKDSSDTLQISLIGAAASFIAVGLAAGQIWPQIAAGYPQDSYWTLHGFGRVGVALINLLGLGLFYALLRWKTSLISRFLRKMRLTARILIDIGLGLFAFAVLFSISPQAFYSFYRLIIPSLPNQWVISGWLNTDRLEMIAKLDANGSLADHLGGVALWAIVPFTLWLHLRLWWRGGA